MEWREILNLKKRNEREMFSANDCCDECDVSQETWEYEPVKCRKIDISWCVNIFFVAAAHKRLLKNKLQISGSLWKNYAAQIFL